MQLVVDLFDPLHSRSGLFSLGLEVGAWGLACQQHDTVVAGDHDVRAVIQIRVGLGDVDGHFGFNQRIVDFAAERAGATVVFNRCVTGSGQY